MARMIRLSILFTALVLSVLDERHDITRAEPWRLLQEPATPPRSVVFTGSSATLALTGPTSGTVCMVNGGSATTATIPEFAFERAKGVW